MKNEAEAGSRKPEAGSPGIAPARIVWKTFRLCLLAFILHPSSFILSTSAQQPASRPAHPVPTGPLTYESFHLLHTRNVFDPDRRPVRASATTASVGRADYIALTGTLIDGDKTYAFFSGSRADFNKVLSVRDKIANATITQITPMNIVVDRGGKGVTVTVGQTVPLDEKSAPGAAPTNYVEVTATGIDRPAPPPTSDNPPAPDNNPAAVASPAPGASPAAIPAKGPAASREEIIRRMMEKRQQDLR